MVLETKFTHVCFVQSPSHLSNHQDVLGSIPSFVLLTFFFALPAQTYDDNGVFPKWGRTFTEINEFRESEKSLKHELGSV